MKMLLEPVFFTPTEGSFSAPVTGIKPATSLAEPPKPTAPLTTDLAGATALAMQNKAVLLRSGKKARLNVLETSSDNHDLVNAARDIEMMITVLSQIWHQAGLNSLGTSEESRSAMKRLTNSNFYTPSQAMLNEMQEDIATVMQIIALQNKMGILKNKLTQYFSIDAAILKNFSVLYELPNNVMTHFIKLYKNER